MRQIDVPIVVLQHEGSCALQDTGAAAGKPRRVPAARNRFTAGFDANQPDAAIVHERVEDADGIAAAADAGDDGGGQRAGHVENLRARLAANHRLKLADHQRIRMGAEHRSQEVVGVGDVGDPVAHRLVDRVLQRAAAGVDAAHFRAQQAHAKHVERLPIHVRAAHVDVAVEAEQRARRRRGHAVLAGAGLRDDPPFPHADGEQRLAQRVVDLVGSRVREVLAFEEDARAAGGFRQPLRLVDRCRAPDVVLQQPVQFGAECLVVADGEVRAFQLFDRLDQRFGDEPPTVRAEVAACVRIASRTHLFH
jgi:hypothetical protein